MEVQHGLRIQNRGHWVPDLDVYTIIYKFSFRASAVTVFDCACCASWFKITKAAIPGPVGKDRSGCYIGRQQDLKETSVIIDDPLRCLILLVNLPENRIE